MSNLISVKQVCKKVSLSRQHVLRLMSEGKFPKRIPLGDTTQQAWCRWAWLESEVDDWIDERVKHR